MNNEINNSVSEGQTQVYLDGSIDPQYGINTAAPHLNAPPKQLLDLMAQFYKSGKSDSQVLAILVGMGVEQQLVLSGIAAYKSAISMYNENNQKNHNKMNFTLTELYENVKKSIDTLTIMKADGSRISYSADTALNILEKSLGLFPHKFYEELTKLKMPSSDVNESLITEDLSTAFVILMSAAAVGGATMGHIAAVGGVDDFTPIKNLKAWWQERKSDKALKSIINKIKDDEDIVKFMKLTPAEQRGKFRSLIATKLSDNELDYLNKINRSHFQKESVNENTGINYQSDKYALVKLGELRGGHSNIPVFVGQTMGVLVETNNDESVLVEKSKRLLNELTNAQNVISSTSYKIIELTPAKVNEISNFISYQKSSEDTSINEDLVNPNLKYKIAKSLHRDLTQCDWLNPVKELRTYIDNMYNNSKWSFRISEAIENNQFVKGPLAESLVNDLNNTLKGSANVKESFSKIATKYPWSNDVKYILNEMAIEDKQAVSNGAGTISAVISPVVENENGLNFFLHGKTYAIQNGQIKESVVNDQRFFNVLEGLNMFKHIGNSLVLFGQDDKSMEYNIAEGKLTLGSINLSDATPDKIKESLLSTNFFGYQYFQKADTVARFFESIDLLYEMDNFTNVSSNQFASLYLTMIAVEEGYWVNKVNHGMKLNEMVFIQTATETVKTIKEFINYDATLVLSDKLIAEGNREVKLTKERADLSEQIQFLEERKLTINQAINKIGKSEELQEALNMLNAEIAKCEKALQETYLVSEKKTKKQYLDAGFVDANVFKSTSGLAKGQNVLVNAEEYTSLGDNDLLTIVDPDTGNETIIKKGNLKVEI
jgi:hypothetical protein